MGPAAANRLRGVERFLAIRLLKIPRQRGGWLATGLDHGLLAISTWDLNMYLVVRLCKWSCF